MVDKGGGMASKRRPRHSLGRSALHGAGNAQGGPGDRLARLLAVRELLEAAITACESARDLPALSREYRLVLAEIDATHTTEEADVVDQLAQRRRAQTEGSA